MRNNFIKAVGLLFAVVGIFFLIESCGSFIEQLGQRDWIETTATVINTSERRESTGIRHASSKIVYDLDYEYFVDGKRYEGERNGTVEYKAVGETLHIKYNGDNPEENTYILEPSVVTLITNILFSILFSFIGLFVSGILNDIRDYANKKKISA